MRQPCQQCTQFVAVGHIEKRGGFVEQDNRRILRQRPCDHDALALAVRHLVHRALRISLHAHRGERPHDDLLVDLLHLSNPVGIGCAADSHDILAFEIGDACALGRDECQRSGHFCCSHIGGVMPVEQDSAGITAVQSGDGSKQCRFARAVAPDKGSQPALFYGGFHLAEQGALAVAYGKIV